jgi:VWFA-related protein
VTRQHVLAFAVAGLSTAVSAQTPQLPAQGAPAVTFQAEVNYVDVDTIVTDALGNFVGGLSKDDFEVREDGKPQTIDMFAMVDIPLERRDRFLFLDRPAPSDVRSNREAFAGRLYVILLDDLNINPLRTAQTKTLARRFVEKNLGANDVAAVVYTSGRTDATQEFTGDSQLLLSAIDKFFGRRLRPAPLDRVERYYQNLVAQQPSDNGVPDPQANGPPQRDMTRFDSSDFERSQRAMGVMDTLKNLSDYLSTVRGRRKAVVMLSEGIDFPMNDLFGAGGTTNVVRATQDAVTSAARANVNFFTVDPRGLIGLTTEFIEMSGTGMPDVLGSGAGNSANSGALTPFDAQRELVSDMRVSQESLRTLAEETGGFAALDSNATSDALDRIVAANSRYYVLGYYPPSHPRNGAFHKIEVRVRRPGLKVSARKGYASPRGKPPERSDRTDAVQRLRERTKGGADNTSPPLRAAIDSPMQQGGLSFSVQAAPFKKSGKESSIALAIDFEPGALQLARQNDGLFTDGLELAFFGVSEQGKATEGTRMVLNLTLKPETYQRVQTAGLRANPRISVPPGRYQVRIGARQSGTGRIGSVFYDLQVPDFTKNPLMMSGLLLSAPSSERVLTALPDPDPTVSKLLPGAATSRREFARSDTLSVVTEIYDNTKPRQPRQIDLVTHLLSETGSEVFTARDTLTNGADGKAWNSYAYTCQLPLREVAVGRYLLRVDAQMRGHSDALARRETSISIR